MAGAAILNVLTGAPRWLGSLIGGGIMTVYFAAGGLLGSAWVNTLQLSVMLGGIRVGAADRARQRRGLGAFLVAGAAASFHDITYSAGPRTGWTFLGAHGPASSSRPGLIQKSYGAASARAT
jgi:Na+(H+)/acetate symporter ActP